MLRAREIDVEQTFEEWLVIRYDVGLENCSISKTLDFCNSNRNQDAEKKGESIPESHFHMNLSAWIPPD
jgi:hypothetical protein